MQNHIYIKNAEQHRLNSVFTSEPVSVQEESVSTTVHFDVIGFFLPHLSHQGMQENGGRVVTVSQFLTVGKTS